MYNCGVSCKHAKTPKNFITGAERRTNFGIDICAARKDDLFITLEGPTRNKLIQNHKKEQQSHKTEQQGMKKEQQNRRKEQQDHKKEQHLRTKT